MDNTTENPSTASTKENILEGDKIHSSDSSSPKVIEPLQSETTTISDSSTFPQNNDITPSNATTTPSENNLSVSIGSRDISNDDDVDEFGLPQDSDNNNNNISQSLNKAEDDEDEEEGVDEEEEGTEDDNISSSNSSSALDLQSLKIKGDVTIPPIVPTKPRQARIFENFIVVGLSDNTKSPPRIGTIHRPELLFSYPPGKPVPPKVQEFCFPNGISPYLIKRTPSFSNLNEVLYGQPYLHSSTFFYTFVLTGETPLYGICITKPELLNTIPNFFPEQPTPLERKPTYITASRSYCFISKYPLFNVHFDALLYLLAQDRLITITRELCSTQLEGGHDEEYDEYNNNNTTVQPEQKEPEKINTPTTTSTTTTTNTIENEDNTTPTLTTNQLNIIEQQKDTPEEEESKEKDKETPTGSEQSSTSNQMVKNSSENDFLKERDYKHLVDKKNLLDILHFYYSEVPVPKGGDTLEFTLPGEVKRSYQIPAGANIEEVNSKSVADWSVIGLFMHLSLENILKVLGAILLEQRVVFVCDNLSVLSSACFTMTSFIYPFIWQGLFVPILPTALSDYLEAPVPYIVGVQTLRKRTCEGLIVDIANDKVQYNKISTPPPLPEFRKLQRNLSGDQQVLLNEKNHNPIKNTPTQVEAIHRIYNTIQQYIWWLVKKIEGSFIVNDEILADSLKIQALKTKFISTVSGHNKEFVTLLLDTQHFAHFLHNTLSTHQHKQQQQ